MASAARTAAACLSEATKAAIRPSPYGFGYGYASGALRSIDIQLDSYVPQEVSDSTSKGDLLMYIGDLERVLDTIRMTVDGALPVVTEVDAQTAPSFARQHSEEAF